MKNLIYKRFITFTSTLLIMLFYSFSLTKVYANSVQNIPGGNYYIDEIGLLDKETKEFINKKNEILTDELGSEILVVTTGPLTDNTPFDYSVDLFEKYKPGAKDKDNGMLLLVSIDESQEKKYQLELRVGYGIEGILNDGKVGRILDDEVIPSFKTSDYNKGIQKGLSVFSDELIANRDEIASAIISTEDTTTSVTSSLIELLFVAFILIMIVRRGKYIPVTPAGGSYGRYSSNSSGTNSPYSGNSSFGGSSSNSSSNSPNRRSGGGRTGGGGASR